MKIHRIFHFGSRQNVNCSCERWNVNRNTCASPTAAMMMIERTFVLQNSFAWGEINFARITSLPQSISRLLRAARGWNWFELEFEFFVLFVSNRYKFVADEKKKLQVEKLNFHFSVALVAMPTQSKNDFRFTGFNFRCARRLSVERLKLKMEFFLCLVSCELKRNDKLKIVFSASPIAANKLNEAQRCLAVSAWLSTSCNQRSRRRRMKWKYKYAINALTRWKLRIVFCPEKSFLMRMIASSCACDNDVSI